MAQFIIYDPNTGEIAGRITCPDNQAANYLNRREVSIEEFHSRPELFQKVNVTNRNAPLVALSEAEARAKGASERFINDRIGEGKIRRDEER